MKTNRFGIAGAAAFIAIVILLATNPLFIAHAAFADSGQGHHYNHHHHHHHYNYHHNNNHDDNNHDDNDD
jgi:hypothetical protein